MTKSAMLRLLRRMGPRDQDCNRMKLHFGDDGLCWKKSDGGRVADAARPLARRHQARRTRRLASAADRAEGYAIQAAIERYSTTHLFGWKIAATSEAGQKHINVDGPMAGRILAETVIADGGTASMAGNEMRVAEPEFAFRMRDRPAGAIGALHACSRCSMRSTRCIPAIEIPDSRFADFVGAGAAQMIADNACAHLFVLGPATTRELARPRSGRGEARHHACAASNLSVTARTCSAIPGSR